MRDETIEAFEKFLDKFEDAINPDASVADKGINTARLISAARKLTLAIDHLNAKEVIARETLNSIASWDEGKTVTPGFDEPCAAQEARNALAMMDEVMTKGVV